MLINSALIMIYFIKAISIVRVTITVTYNFKTRKDL